MPAQKLVKSSELRVQSSEKRHYELRTTNSFGFTLIELLVVIIIIAILATIGLVTYGSAQKQARIAKRIQDLKAIQTALGLYYNTNSKHPLSGAFVCLNSLTGTNSLSPTYMPAIPNDPSGSSYCYQYRSTSATVGDDYKVTTNGSLTEMSSDDYKSQPNLIDPAKDGGSSCSTVEVSGTISGWAIYSSNTGSNDTANNPACWGSSSPPPGPSPSP